MNWRRCAAILGIDGLANGAVYACSRIGFVLIFSVTRVVFVPFGDVAAFTALTLASLETRQTAGHRRAGAVLAVLATVIEVDVAAARAASARPSRARSCVFSCLPLVPVACVWFTAGLRLPMPAQRRAWRCC